MYLIDQKQTHTGFDEELSPSPPPLPPVLSRRHAIRRTSGGSQDSTSSRSTGMMFPPRPPPVFRSNSSGPRPTRAVSPPRLNGISTAPSRARSDPMVRYGFRNQVDLNLQSFASFKATFDEEEHMKVFRESAVLSLRKETSKDAPKLKKSSSSSSSTSSVKLSSFDRMYQFLILESVALRGSMMLRPNSIRTKTWVLRHTGMFLFPKSF